MRIREHALAWAVAEIDASRIDAWNIYQASRQAMVAAVSQLSPFPDYLLLDAMELDLPIEQKALIHGDARSVSIAAASILAKVERDQRMEEFDEIYPQYGLAQNKGYGTPDHLDALRRHGPYAAAPVFLRAGAGGALLGLRSRRRLRCRWPDLTAAAQMLSGSTSLRSGYLTLPRTYALHGVLAGIVLRLLSPSSPRLGGF